MIISSRYNPTNLNGGHMACDRRCFDPDSCWHDYEDCATCPGADISRPLEKAKQPVRTEPIHPVTLADYSRHL